MSEVDGRVCASGLFQLSASDVNAINEQSVDLGASLVTPQTPFFGFITLARVEDPWSVCGGCINRCPAKQTLGRPREAGRTRSFERSMRTCGRHNRKRGSFDLSSTFKHFSGTPK